MALNIRRALAELMGKEKLSDDDVRAELDELKVDNKLDELTREGHLPADPLVQQLARDAIKGKATAESIEQLLRAPKATPAITTTITPAAGPAAAGNDDPVEAAIQTEMARSGTPYHEAASVVAKGGAIAPAGKAEGAQ